MQTKDSVLDYLQAHAGVSVSGQEMAEALGLSRAAVWKAVQSLRTDGYSIAAGTNRGYCLTRMADVLDGHRIAAYAGVDADRVHVYDSVTSTNAVALEQAQYGAPHASVIVSSEQTQGRGQIGRTFFSPQGGIYVSVLLRPKCSLQQAARMTPAAAVAVRRAILRCTGKVCGIKWVNDLYLDGKKVCGILTQAQADVESGNAYAIVVGIGVNYLAPDGGYPTELQNKAGALFDSRAQADASALTRNRLAGEIVKELLACTQKDDRGWMEEYRAASVVLGKRVSFVYDRIEREGIATAIDDDGGLTVRTQDGDITLRCGEVSLATQGAWN